MIKFGVFLFSICKSIIEVAEWDITQILSVDRTIDSDTWPWLLENSANADVSIRQVRANWTCHLACMFCLMVTLQFMLNSIRYIFESSRGSCYAQTGLSIFG